jgi:hypothetical protein
VSELDSESASMMTKFLNSVSAFTGPKGVPSQDDSTSRKVIPNKSSRRPPINPILSGNEERYFFNVGTSIAEAFVNLFKKTKGDTSKPQTIISEKQKQVEESKTSNLPKLPSPSEFSILSILAAGIVALAVYISKIFGPTGEFILKVITKIQGAIFLLSKLKIGEKITGFFTRIVKFISEMDIGKKLSTMFDSVKGIFNKMPLLGKIGGKLGLVFKSVGKFIASKLGFIVRRIPLIGALINFTYAYQRWQKGEYIKSVLEILSGIANISVMFGFLPGAAISLAIDGLLLVSDLLEEKDVGAKASAAVKGTKLGAKLLIGYLKKTASEIGPKLLKVIKWLPFVGGVAGLALAYLRFKEGDWIAGIFELVGAVADFIPGAGTVVSWIIDGGLLLYDILKTPKVEGQEGKPTTTTTNFMSTMKDLAKTVGNKLVSAMWYIPGISSILYFGQGIKKIKSGDILNGLKDIGSAMLAFAGGKALVESISWLVGLFSAPKTETGEVTAKKITFGDIIQSSILSLIDMIANAVTSIVDWGKTIISETLDKVNEYNPVAIGFQAAHDKKMAEFAERDIKTEAELKVARARAAERAKERERDKASGKELSPLEQRIEDRRERNKTTAAAITTANTSIDPKLDEQTNLINLQNQILLQLLGTSKEQLNVTKKQKPTVIADTNNTQSNVSANLNNAFSTSKQDSRGMYTSSPYSLSPA